MRNVYLANERVQNVDEDTNAASSASSSSHLLLHECFELYHATCTGLAKLSIDTSNDLFEMDPRVTPEEIHEFRSKRSLWLAKFDETLRELFEKRISGQGRKGRRPDPVQSFESLEVM